MANTANQTRISVAGRLGLIVLGAAIALLAIPVVGYLYLAYGNPPVAAGDAPFPYEAKIVKIPLEARIDRQMIPAPIPASPENLIAGAHIYAQQCEMCHGTEAEPSALGHDMFPHAPQLWSKHKSGVVGVSDDPVGETYWKVKNGIRLTGMPSYQKALTEQQMWQVSLLLSVADKPLPAEAVAAVTQ